MIVEDTERNSSRCRCPGCPTHEGCMSRNDERLYCSRDRTDCDVTAHGCLCNECPVWSDNRLGGRYFCIEGAAR